MNNTNIALQLQNEIHAHQKYKTKYLQLKELTSNFTDLDYVQDAFGNQIGGVPYTGRFVVFFIHDNINTNFVKTLSINSSIKLSDIKKNLIGSLYISNNKRKVKSLLMSSVMTRIISKIAPIILKKKIHFSKNISIIY